MSASPVGLSLICEIAKPAGLLIEQSRQFELVLNQRTAMAIGLKISEVLIERTDRVIE